MICSAIEDRICDDNCTNNWGCERHSTMVCHTQAFVYLLLLHLVRELISTHCKEYTDKQSGAEE